MSGTSQSTKSWIRSRQPESSSILRSIAPVLSLSLSLSPVFSLIDSALRRVHYTTLRALLGTSWMKSAWRRRRRMPTNRRHCLCAGGGGGGSGGLVVCWRVDSPAALSLSLSSFIHTQAGLLACIDGTTATTTTTLASFNLSSSLHQQRPNQTLLQPFQLQTLFWRARLHSSTVSLRSFCRTYPPSPSTVPVVGCWCFSAFCSVQEAAAAGGNACAAAAHQNNTHTRSDNTDKSRADVSTAAVDPGTILLSELTN